jgi:hypothetical protein
MKILVLKSGEEWIDSQASDMEVHRQRMMQNKFKSFLISLCYAFAIA